jgi:hypothetical protein
MRRSNAPDTWQELLHAESPLDHPLNHPICRSLAVSQEREIGTGVRGPEVNIGAQTLGLREVFVIIGPSMTLKALT